MIRRICAWCLAYLGHKKDGKDYEVITGVSHGMCRQCYQEQTDHSGWDQWRRLCSDLGGEGGA